MSVPYGMPASGAYQPPGRVNFGWIGESFNLFGKAAGIWVLGILIYGIVSNAVNGVLVSAFPNPNYVVPPGPFGGNLYRGIQYGTNSNVTALGQVIALLFALIFGAFQSASLYQVAVKQVRGQSIAFGDLFSGGPYFGNMLLLNAALSVLYFFGFLALCIGDFVVAAFFLPVAALVVDGRTAGQALSESVAGMKKDWLSAVLFVFVFTLLIIASLIPCALGLFVTIPMLHLVTALAYRDMIGMPGVNQAAPAYGAAAPGVWPPAPSAAPPPPQWGTPPADAPPAYPGYVPQPTSPPPPPAPSWGTTPVPPQSYPSVPAQQYPPAEPTVYPPAQTPAEFPPASPPEEPPTNPPASPWSPRPPSGP